MLGVFLDTETNGLNSQIHQILEIALQIVDLKNGKQLAFFEAIISHSKDVWEKSDQESLKINGFTWEKVRSGILAKDVSKTILDLFATWKIQRKKAVFICQNPSFDRAFFSQLISPEIQEELNWPYHWLDLASMHWAISMEKAIKEKSPLPCELGCSKDQIAKAYHLPPEEKPHRAMNGVKHLLLCYQAIVGYPERN